MSTKRKHPQQRRQANVRAEAARARQQQSRRRRLIATGIVLIAALALLAAVVFLTDDDDGETDLASDTTTTTAAAAESVAGKPCVPVADTPPPGAPSVPVKTGPPPTELVTEDLVPGTGAEVKQGDTLTVNYIGVSCSTGKIFDSSYQRNQPATFPLAQVIAGWQEGIPGMKVGGQRLLGIPPDKAYGSAGQPPTIAPDETLWFVVEVLEAKAA